MHLLVTRPEPDGERTAALLRARGHRVTLAPLLRVEPIADADLGRGPFAGVVMTSANAARVMATHPRRAEILSLPLFAVGARTGDAARDAGFASVISADGAADDLGRLLAGRAGPFLYLAGEERVTDFAGLPVTVAVVYRAAAATAFPAVLRVLLAQDDIEGVLHFSRRSAMTYVDCARQADVRDRALAPFHYCLSRAVAEPLAAAGARRVLVASRPDEAALIDRIDER